MSQDSPQRKPRRKGPARLSDLVPGTIEPALRQRGFATSAILTEWREIVGPRLAEWTRPLEIRWPRRTEIDAPAGKNTSDKAERARRATLIVACPGAFALDVQMASAGLIEAVNRRLGFGCIGAIVVHQMPKAPAPAPPRSRQLDPALVARMEQGLGRIEAEDLRHALAVLGAGITRKAEEMASQPPEAATVPAQKPR
ncbi:MAG: DciA family protein [Beijerinckiaceae bacterium]|nr:DciA family protein [Beijerinckiaceae bacterium]